VIVSLAPFPTISFILTVLKSKMLALWRFLASKGYTGVSTNVQQSTSKSIQHKEKSGFFILDKKESKQVMGISHL